ncbi:MAG: endopeptidase La, partial [Oscillospiraceae bacterium]
KQKLLECNNTHQALEMLAEILERECSLLDIEHEIYEKVKEKMDKNQRDYFLREQQRVISEELNDGDSPLDDADEFSDKVCEIKNISEESRERLLKECDKLARMPMQSQEASVIRSYLEVCLDLPFDTFTKDTLDIVKAKKQLDHDHYGLDKVKDRILELLSVRKLKPDVKGQIICLVGPPGVGKTSIAASIAKALNRRYVRLSLGGINDESEIRGHRKTYLGSMPGRIIQALRQAKTYNPLILLDEIDKMSSNFRGDPASAMLEVLDSEQNNTFADHYVEIPFDLSRALFITTANNVQSIPSPLLDRMEVIELSSYTREEKFNIAKHHLVKKQIEKNGLTTKQLSIKDSALYEILDCYTREAGVRNLERKIGSICRKTAKYIVSGEKEKVVVTDKNIEEFLSARRYKKTLKECKDVVGVVNGLAWTSVGGEMLDIECSIMDGTGKVKLTGSLGDVMKESADIAISFVRTIASEYNIKPDFYKTCDIHIHAPEGAVPKDGPSAGVTMVTALVSALTNIPVRGDVAMTGEISLRGRV